MITVLKEVISRGISAVREGIEKIAKKIRNKSQLDKAIAFLGDENPFYILFDQGDLKESRKCESLIKTILYEKKWQRQRNWWLKLKKFVSSDKDYSSIVIKKAYKEKKQQLKNQFSAQKVRSIGEKDYQENLLRLKAAYRVLKSSRSRAEYERQNKCSLYVYPFSRLPIVQRTIASLGVYIPRPLWFFTRVSSTHYLGSSPYSGQALRFQLGFNRTK